MKLFNLKIKPKKSILNILFKVVVSLTALFLLFITLSLILFLIFKDDISKILLLRMNQNIHGRISFSDISLSPLKHFPNIALKLDDLNLTESKDSAKEDSTLPILKFEDVYLSLNIIDLLSSRINISKITIENGTANLVVYADGLINLDKAIKGMPKVKPPEEVIKKNLFKRNHPQRRKNRLKKNPLIYI